MAVMIDGHDRQELASSRPFHKAANYLLDEISDLSIQLRKQVKRLTAFSLTVAAVAFLWLALSADGDTPTALAQTGDTPAPEATKESGDDFGDQQFPPFEGKINPPEYPNVDSNLNGIVEQAQSGQFTSQAAATNAPVHSGASVAVTFYITEGYAQDVWDWLEESGASPRNIGIDYIEAYVPVSILPSASEREGVISVRTIVPPQPAQGTVVSEGVAAHGVPAWHAAGLKGQGVKIGVIDVGFKDFQSLMGTELPSTVEARCYTDVGVFTSNPTDCIPTEVPESTKLHGTAVTEAAFDIAPEAEYYIANIASFGDLANTVDWMVAEGVDVINMSLGFIFSGPGDGTSPFTDSPLRTVDAAVEGGIIWVNSAGNSARVNWFGPFTDSNANGVHDFSATGAECNVVRIELEPLTGFTAQLRWDDSWGGANSDLDLYLIPVFGSTFRLADAVVFSEQVQAGGAADYPYEVITLNYGDAPNGVYCLAINSFNDTAPSWIQLYVWGAAGALRHYTPDHSIANPAESANPGLLAVGATGRNAGSDGNSFDNPFDTTIIESFSSQGPTLDDRVKPDIVGADAGQSVTYRSERNPNGYFFGTSQASPHVAGLAALVKQRFPEYDPQQIAQYLKDHAEERGAAGTDNVWGHGFAKLLASGASPDATPVLSADATLSGLTLTAGSEAVALAESFAADTTTYTASVAYPVTRLDVAAVPSDADAEGVSITPADADVEVEGHQVDLAVGENTITVTVTAEDGTMMTYTVMVTVVEPLTDEGRLLARYDTNGDGSIDAAELAEAIDDYLNGDLSPSDMGILIGIYLG